jgi:hypothetical protein
MLKRIESHKNFPAHPEWEKGKAAIFAKRPTSIFNVFSDPLCAHLRNSGANGTAGQIGPLKRP